LGPPLPVLEEHSGPRGSHFLQVRNAEEPTTIKAWKCSLYSCKFAAIWPRQHPCSGSSVAFGIHQMEEIRPSLNMPRVVIGTFRCGNKAIRFGFSSFLKKSKCSVISFKPEGLSGAKSIIIVLPELQEHRFLLSFLKRPSIKNAHFDAAISVRELPARIPPRSLEEIEPLRFPWISITTFANRTLREIHVLE